MISLSTTENRKPIRSVAVIGAGVAGLAAASALAEAGYQVHLLERRPYVGGRASSYEHPGTGEVIDNCQHILLGCCTNLIHLYQQLGVGTKIRWSKRITFVEPGGRRSVLRPSRLPAPLHSSLSFLSARAFSLRDKLSIARGMFAFLHGSPPDTGESFAHWLQRRRQTSTAIERFWKPVMLSALNDDMERISVPYAGKVIQESFLSSAEAGFMGVPTLPLSELYGAAIGYIRDRGGCVSLRAGVEQLAWDATQSHWRIMTSAGEFTSDAVVVALPFEGMAKLLPALPAIPERDMLAEQLAKFEHSPITGIHLWFDREITDLEHAALLDSPIHWLYNTSRIQDEHRNEDCDGRHGSHIELVVSASKTLIRIERQPIVDMALGELARFFPAVREATLLKAAVTKEVRATYSVRPGLDAMRPAAVTSWPGLFLAGDWTATGWPATMEGAVRSGYLAAEAVSRESDRPRRFLQPDLPARGLMRLLR